MTAADEEEARTHGEHFIIAIHGEWLYRGRQIVFGNT